MSCCSHCVGAGEIFDPKTAARDLRRYVRKGPDRSTRLLTDRLLKEGVQDSTLLDIGGGVGAISFDLFEAGLAASVHVEASAAYLETCREEAARRELTGSMNFLFGDFIDLAGRTGPADIVTLDRVVCCYPDMETLIEAAAVRAKRFLGLVYPRKRVSIRVVQAAGNFWFRLRGNDFRSYLHDPDAIDRELRRHGLKRSYMGRTLIWETALYER